jgi:hypothetical protein
VLRPASGGGAECAQTHGDAQTKSCNTHECPGMDCPDDEPDCKGRTTTPAYG